MSLSLGLCVLLTWATSHQKWLSLSLTGGFCFTFPLELFPVPTLTFSTFLPTEGSSMTLSCDTTLPADRSWISLRYDFSRDYNKLGWREWSPKFEISALSKEDSGYYWCEAKTLSNSVSKQSSKSHISVQSEHQWARLPGLE